MARHLGGDRVEIYSAGTHPNPKGIFEPAVKVLAEKGIDISNNRSKGLGQVPLAKADIIVTLCDSAASECSAGLKAPKVIHWSTPDPGYAPPDEQLNFTRTICNDLEKKIRDLFSSLVS